MERNICILGDSITWGVSDNEKGGWVSRLWLDSENNKNKEVDIYIYNLGIPGDITTYLLDRMVIECNARAADTIIVAIGINDTAFVNSDKPRTEIDWFRENIQKIMDIARTYTNNITFVGLTPVNEAVINAEDSHYPDCFYNELIIKYDQIIKELCDQNNIKYIYMYDKLTMDDLSDDGIHPNSSGHNKIFEVIKQENII